MLAGKVPFTGETVNHTIVSILEKEPLAAGKRAGELQRISSQRPSRKIVDMRYQSARDLLIDLKNLRRDLDIQGEIERSVVPNREPPDSINQREPNPALHRSFSGSDENRCRSHAAIFFEP